MDLHGKKVLVVGSGISGIGAVKLLLKMGAEPMLYDGNSSVSEQSIREKLPAPQEIPAAAGVLPKEMEESAQVMVLSPGVPADAAFVQSFRSQGKQVLAEIELGYMAEKGKLLAITGTNGKTTTTSLVGSIMRDYYKEVFVVGNIGTPYTEEAWKTSADTVTVAEISSFQLETIRHFKPAVSAILNITPDHLNRHHTMENYVRAKEMVAANQEENDICVLNYDNPYTREFGCRCRARVIYFSASEKLRDGFCLEGENICMAQDGNIVRLMNIHDMKLVGMCNVENVMAAIAISLSAGVPLSSILNTVRDFEAVEHRIEFVATKKGVDYYNDSKATNPDAAIQGIKAMSKPTILIAGGYDKQNEYDEWISCFPGKVKKLVLLGQTKEKIAGCARAHGFGEITMADSFEEAMDLCVHYAERGDAVLLSPACASWGMFSNYEERGRVFKEYVQKIEE